MSPQRIQRKRIEGWRMPEGAIYVGRPGKFGNPFSAVECGDRYPSLTSEQVSGFIVNQFRYDLRGQFPNYPDLATIRAELAGHDLACWCALGEPCHADWLLKLANPTRPA